ncbi:unnamed protein product [Rotaria sp. Silwood2]|nr:unnamed protein product [Rotaria sp. Silwood2]CAF3951169.1 unnamed protein product [Rotaria sp. Silwood2]
MAEESFQLNCSCVNWAVVATADTGSRSIKQAANRLHDWCIVVVADGGDSNRYVTKDKTAKIFYLNKNIQDKFSQISRFVAAIRRSDFRRKNIGYLWAIIHGARNIWDFDDDVELIVDELSIPVNDTEALTFPNMKSVFLNPHSILGSKEQYVYSRGFYKLLTEDPGVQPLDKEGIHGIWPAERLGM